ncbi:transglutaminase domain-containing protein [Bacteroides sp. 51]|uniref:transglutaminase domain-containing protein n=1 Tax=Bacteroides sp. 51 TaxID=2302938 RepID=UPI0013D1A32D|nr:transglutaminase domain-containing protein [Bacteroides sp. 51]NDV84479.1 hypothetical protein [Bacteroides sp. 51]
MRKSLAIYLAIFLCHSISAQIATSVPEELMENAYCVVLDNQIDFICESLTSAVKKETITIMILDQKAKDAGHFTSMCDKFSTLRKFTGEIFDKSGKSIRKIKKSDLKMTEYSSGLTSDDYLYYYECNGPSYPYTVKYEWEVKYKDGLIMFPVFAPQEGFNQSVVTASYRLYVPGTVKYQRKMINTDITPQKKTTPDGECEEIVFKNMKAYENERYGPSIYTLAPIVYHTPLNFFFDGVAGSMESWTNYGLWQNSLLKDRDILPEPFKAKLKDITANCTTDREKVKAVYDYLAETTRYVSIQLGIGGFQPIAAANVNKSGFGDCKGLSNYAMAMLKELGIKSYYTEISTRNSRLLKDFASVNQTNHVILQVPLPNDTLWLECTNPQLPFGYVHSGIAGHDGLLIKEEGGEIYRLPSYPDATNTQVVEANISLDPTGKAEIKAQQISHLHQYESMSYIKQLEPNKQKDYLRSDIQLANASINNIIINEKKEANPSIDIQYTIDCEKYGNKTGNRLFIPVNIFRSRLNTSSKKERIYDIYIYNGYLDTDKIVIQIPEGFTIEAMPKPVELTEKFGKFQSTITTEGKSIVITHQLLLKSGKYPKEDYPVFAQFNQVVSKQYDEKIILRKE